MAASTLDGKTPKMIVGEIYAKKKWQLPRWTSSEEQQVPPIFKCVVTSLIDGKEYSCEGHGATKKEAEQCASLKLIPIVVDMKEYLQMTKMWKLITDDEKRVLQTVVRKDSVDGVVSSDDEDEGTELKVTGEPIGELFQFCARVKLTPPQYEEAQRMGTDNKPRHIMTVKAGTISSGPVTRLRKQDAKRAAAYIVLEKLKASSGCQKKVNLVLPAVAKTSDEVTSTQPCKDLMGSVGKDECDGNVPIQTEEDKGSSSLASSSNSSADALSTPSDDEKAKLKKKGTPTPPQIPTEPNDDTKNGSLKLLEDLLTEMQARLKIYPCKTPLETNTGRNKLAFLRIVVPVVTTLKTGLRKSHTVFGVGKDEESAKNDAAFNALQYVRDMRLAPSPN